MFRGYGVPKAEAGYSTSAIKLPPWRQSMLRLGHEPKRASASCASRYFSSTRISDTLKFSSSRWSAAFFKFSLLKNGSDVGQFLYRW